MTYALVLDLLMELDYTNGICMMIPFMFSFQLRSSASIREFMDATEIFGNLREKYPKQLLGTRYPQLPSARSWSS
jgi:hypothetical protein